MKLDAYLDRVSLPKSPKQAWDVKWLVEVERYWLKKDFPETVERYRDLPHSLYNLARLATHEGLRAYIIRRRSDKLAAGMATIICDQIVTHPVGGEIRGNDLDYWLGPDFPMSMHDATAEALLAESRKLTLALRGEYCVGAMGAEMDRRFVDHACFTTVREDQVHYPAGLTRRLGREGTERVAVLTTPYGGDPFGVTKGGVPLQLYHGSRLVSD
ncbi:MAG TPA: hypothetical protein VLG37_02615 [Candidatus Saccharimonadales bacterium]|nr:hypothetical protein [Candidatus Saccharimonadales bacterium]